MTNSETPSLNSNDPEERISALKSIALAKDFSRLREVGDLATHDPHARVRYFAKKAAAFLAKLAREDEEPMPEGPVTRILKGGDSVPRPAPEDDAPGSSAEGGSTGHGSGEDDKIAKLRTLAASDDPTVREKVARGVVQSGNPEYLDILTALLPKEDDPRVLATMATAIGRLGNETHGNFLARLLVHKDYRVRANAVESAGNLDLRELYPNVIKLLRDEDNRVRANAAAAIRAFKPEKTLEALEQMMSSGRIDLQDSAIYCLERVNMEEAVEILAIGLVDSKSTIREKAVSALQHCASKGFEQAMALLEAYRTGGTEEEIRESSTEDDRVVQAVDGKGHDWNRAAKSPESPGGLDDQDYKVRLGHVLAMGSPGNSDAVIPLVECLGREHDNHVISAILTALGRIGNPSALPAIQPFLKQGDLRTRANAVEAIGLLGNLATREEYLTEFLNDRNHRIRANAIVALEDSPKSDTGTLLRKMTDDPEPVVRKAAIHAVRRIGSPRYKTVIKRLMGDFDPEVQKLAKTVLNTLSEEMHAPDAPPERDHAPAGPTSEKRVSAAPKHSGAHETQAPPEEQAQGGKKPSATASADNDETEIEIIHMPGDGPVPQQLAKKSFDRRGFESELKALAKAKVESRASELAMGLKSLEAKVERFTQHLGDCAEREGLRSSEKIVKEHIAEIKSLRSQEEQMNKGSVEVVGSGGGLFASLKKVVTNMKEGVDRKALQYRMKAECVALGTLLLQLPGNPFSSRDEGYDIWVEAREVLDEIAEIKQKIAVIDALKGA